MTKHWKANLQHLKIGLERMINNYAVHSDCSEEEAIIIAEKLLADRKKNMKRRSKRKKNTPYSLGPMDPNKKSHDKEDEDED